MLAKRNKKICFVVLNYKTPKRTIESINSIKAIDNNGVSSHIIILENGSGDDSAEILTREFSHDKEVTLITNQKNTGFAGGQYQLKGQIANFDYVALINSDAVVDKKWLHEGLDTFSRNEDIAAVGGRAYQWDGKTSPQESKKSFYSYQFINPIDGFSTTCDYGDEEIEVDAISGAALLLDVKKSLKVGYFNPKYFLYFEETDLQARLKRAGYSVVYNPKMLVWHMIGASSNDPDGKNNETMAYYMFRNRYYFALSNFDDANTKLFLKRNLSYLYNSIFGKNIYGTQTRARSIKVLVWLVFNLPSIRSNRRRIKKLGPNYSSKLELSADKGVDVVITCYNYAQYIGDCIDSVLSQTVKPNNIIIIDDGSTDNSGEIIDKYKHHKNIKIIKQKNSGVVKAKNIGLSLVKSPWVIFLDADDTLDNSYIERTLSKATQEKLDLVYTDSYQIGVRRGKIEYENYNHNTLSDRNFIHNSALMKTQILRYIGGYRIEKGYEDWEMYIRYSKFTKRIARLAEPLLNYRQHSSGRNKQAMNNDDEIREEIQKLHPYVSFLEDVDPAFILRSVILRRFISFIAVFARKPYMLLLLPLALIYAVIMIMKDLIRLFLIKIFNFYGV